MTLSINGRKIEVTLGQRDNTLQEFISGLPNLFGTHFGCGKGLCGACTVHLNGVAVRSCQLLVKDLSGQEITTIEGLNGGSSDELHDVQQAFLDENVPQCGYCMPGQIMSASSLLNMDPNPTNETIKLGMSGNLCRCGTYPRIVKAITRASEIRNQKEG